MTLNVETDIDLNIKKVDELLEKLQLAIKEIYDRK